MVARKFVLAGGIVGSALPLLTEILDTHPLVRCRQSASVFCDPNFWSSGPSSLQERITNDVGKSVPWHPINETIIRDAGLDRDSLIALAERSRDCDDFVDGYFGNPSEPLVVDSNAANLFAIDQFLKKDATHAAVVLVQHPLKVIAALQHRGVPARIAVAMWLFDASLAKQLLERYRPLNQLVLVRHQSLVTNQN